MIVTRDGTDPDMTLWPSVRLILICGALASSGAAYAKDRRADTPASAQDTSVVDDVLRRITPWTDAGEPADWVKATRSPGELNYVPVGVNPPPRAIKVKTPAELAAMKADLESTQARHAKLASEKPTLTSAAAPGAPAKAGAAAMARAKKAPAPPVPPGSAD
jgi:hypothetical protein